MDSLSQLALGAAVGVAVMGRRTAVWKAALWGGVCGSLPDLDALIDHGDAIANMTLHRTESHALLYLTLGAPAIAWLVSRLHGQRALFGRWWMAVWLALVTHPLLDLMTVYGTQLLLPFTHHPYYVGSIFIVDPLYTLPLLVGVGAALVRPARLRGLRWNAAGLVLSTAYLAWSAAAQWHVTTLAQTALRAQGLEATQLLVTPTPLNTVLWRVLAMTPGGYAEGFHRLGDPVTALQLQTYPRGDSLAPVLQASAQAARLAWFTHGFYKLEERTDRQVVMSDLRMGLEPGYSFSFAVAQREGDRFVPLPPRTVATRPDVKAGLQWLWQRLQGGTPPWPG